MKCFVLYKPKGSWICDIDAARDRCSFTYDISKAFNFGSLRAASMWAKSSDFKDLAIIEVSHWYDSN